MKRLRLFGLLATVLVLAFGLTISCDNGTTTTDNTEPVTTTYYDTANNITITFSNKAIEARARAAGPNDGDYYQIKRGSALLSSGTIQLQGNGTTIKFIEDSGATFTGQLLNNLLTISDTVGGQALTVSAAVPGSSGGGGPSGTGGDGGGGSSPSGGGATGTGAKIAKWLLTIGGETDQGFTITSATPGYSAGGQEPEYAAGLSSGNSPTTAWQKALDFNGLQPDKEYAVWARMGAVAAADSDDGIAYAAGPSVKGTELARTKAKGLTGASITSFTVVKNSTLVDEETIGLANPAVSTNNPGGQPIEYAASKTTTAPTSGWVNWTTISTTGITGLDSGTPYNLFARTAYYEVGGVAYSAGPALKGDAQITTLDKPGSDLTVTGITISQKPATAAATDPVLWGRIYISGIPKVDDNKVQGIEYTYSTDTTIIADDYEWWTPGAAAKPPKSTGDPAKVGQLTAQVQLVTSGDGLVFTGILGPTAATTALYNVFARAKAGDGYLAGAVSAAIRDGESTPAGIRVLLAAPQIVAYTVSGSAITPTPTGFTVEINKTHGAEASSLTNPYYPTSTPIAFEYALYSAATAGSILKTWDNLTIANLPEITVTGLETDVDHFLRIRVKEGVVFAQSTDANVGPLATPLKPTGGGTTNTLTAWAPAAPAAGTLKGLKFTVAGSATVVETADPTQSVTITTAGTVEYWATTSPATTAPTTTIGMIKASEATLGTMVFEGLTEGATYKLWARLASTAAEKTGGWVAATGANAAGVTTDTAAIPTTAILNAITIGSRTTTGFAINNITDSATGQDWAFAATTGNTAPVTGWTTIAPTGTSPNKTTSISDLAANTTYNVWMRSMAATGDYGTGSPRQVTARGVTIREGAKVGGWLAENDVVATITGTQASAATVIITFTGTSLPAIEGQIVEFGIVNASNTYTWGSAGSEIKASAISNGVPNTALAALISTAGAGTYRIAARSMAIPDQYDAGAGVPIDDESDPLS